MAPKTHYKARRSMFWTLKYARKLLAWLAATLLSVYLLLLLLLFLNLCRSRFPVKYIELLKERIL